MRIIQTEIDAIMTFKSRWPCNGFPKKLDHIVAAFLDEKDGVGRGMVGDLIDYSLYDSDDKELPVWDIDGSAISALLDDAFTYAVDDGALRGIPGVIENDNYKFLDYPLGG